MNLEKIRDCKKAEIFLFLQQTTTCLVTFVKSTSPCSPIVWVFVVVPFGLVQECDVRTSSLYQNNWILCG